MLFNKAKAPEAPSVPPQTGGIIFDVGNADFETRVLTASLEKPVIVQFTAPWCGPCKQLGPLLEKTVNAAGGQVLMARVNIDENQELAQALRIQSVPTVYAFFGGRPVDAFQGSVPESQLKAFVDRLVQIVRAAQPEALDIPQSLKAAGDMVLAGDFTGAQTLYARILGQDENNVTAYVGLVRATIAAGALDQAKALVEQAPPDIAKQSAFAEARTAIEMATKPGADTAALEKKIATDPKNYQARSDLAAALFAAGRHDESMDPLLYIIAADRTWNEDGARLQLLKFFEALGGAHPAVIQGRKKLSTLLFS
jgi:putative thioredoxin